ncbi:hypothetical protein SHELI_v1c09800 [Spiroplasma helicoides]|uniref:Uncharacterized protein n=1 Tax=Spiroplasma helicoides TaxID=216938 RepID=A0A1B3SLZ0_9MOLU|nr:hypothetical protein [Spiroplasma helicoides]AOG60927.1 hypothetical protein SHELI_v1c09800 [Spiroplasma helicoides]
MKKEIIWLVSSYFMLFVVTLGIGYAIFHNDPVKETAKNITNINISNVNYSESSKRLNMINDKEYNLLDIDNYYDIVSHDYKISAHGIASGYTQNNGSKLDASYFSDFVTFQYRENKWKLVFCNTGSYAYDYGWIDYSILIDNQKGLHYNSNVIRMYY